MGVEAARSPRTWWLTLTFSEAPETPKSAYQAGARFMRKLRDAGETIRYAMIVEHGTKRGRLHLHAVLHCEDTLSKRKLEAAWPHGFTQARLVRASGDEASEPGRVNVQTVREIAGYLGGYVTKSVAPIRFSGGYGKRKKGAPASEAEMAAARILQVDGARIRRITDREAGRVPLALVRDRERKLRALASQLPEGPAVDDAVIAAVLEALRQGEAEQSPSGSLRLFEPDAADRWEAENGTAEERADPAFVKPGTHREAVRWLRAERDDYPGEWLSRPSTVDGVRDRRERLKMRRASEAAAARRSLPPLDGELLPPVAAKAAAPRPREPATWGEFMSQIMCKPLTGEALAAVYAEEAAAVAAVWGGGFSADDAPDVLDDPGGSHD